MTANLTGSARDVSTRRGLRTLQGSLIKSRDTWFRMLTRDCRIGAWGRSIVFVVTLSVSQFSEDAPFSASVGDCVSLWQAADGVALAVRAPLGPAADQAAG